MYWALKGAEVICSDIREDIFEKAYKLHYKYGVHNRIQYQKIDATKIPYQNAIDIICFKSVLGGVGYNNNYAMQEKMLESIYLALNENGRLCFCENLLASPIHQFARKRFTDWGNRWRYVTMDEIEKLTSKFYTMENKTFGFFGMFGRTEQLSKILGILDDRLDRYVKVENRYIVSCVCGKARSKRSDWIPRKGRDIEK